MRVFLLLAAILPGLPAAAQFDLEESHTTASLRGISTAGPGIAWASGSGGTILRTEDGGYLWQVCSVPPGGEKLDFRAVQALDANTALAMSAGSGPLSRVFRTTDGCQSWQQVLANPDPAGFFDALVLTPGSRIVTLLGDPVTGADGRARFVLYRSADFGLHWTRVDSASLATAAVGIGAFAASNSSLLPGPLTFATGGPLGPFLYLADAGGDFHSQRLPMVGDSASAGIFSLARAGSVLVAVGGDYTHPEVATGTAATSSDAGHTWTAARTPPHGYRSAVAYDPEHGVFLAAGPNGLDVSRDQGSTWQPIPAVSPGLDRDWNALALPYAVGAHGRIGKLRPQALGPGRNGAD